MSYSVETSPEQAAGEAKAIRLGTVDTVRGKVHLALLRMAQDQALGEQIARSREAERMTIHDAERQLSDRQRVDAARIDAARAAAPTDLASRAISPDSVIDANAEASAAQADVVADAGPAAVEELSGELQRARANLEDVLNAQTAA